MAQTRRNAVPTNRINRSQSTGSKRAESAYIYGNTVFKPDIRRQFEEEPRKKLSHEARKNRDKAHHMSLGYVIFLMAALCVAGVILINYIQLQSELTGKIKNIASLESELNHLKMSNDEEYNRIVSSIDLEEIKRIAIGELGMTYAKEGQIVTYINSGNDYMRRIAGDTN